MTTRAEIVAAARSLIGTPYVPKGRLPGVGCDCIGVPILSVRAVVLVSADFDVAYSTTPDGSLLTNCDEHMDRVSRGDMQAGDMIVCRWGRQPHHVGILGDYRHGGLSIIHAENERRMEVVEHRLWLDGAMQFVRAYSFRGIE